MKRQLARAMRVDIEHPKLDRRAGTCVTEPECVEGSYYIRNELIRNDNREDSAGVDLELNIQVIDLATCEPLVGSFVELWHANNLGYYSGFTEASSTSLGNDNTSSSGNAPNSSINTLSSVTSIAAPTEMSSATDTAAAAMGTGAPGDMGSGGGGGGGTGTAMTDDQSFLRGGNFVDSTGNITIMTKMPSYYTGRTAHIHLHVFQNMTANPNGTLSSADGHLLHTGQLFFRQDFLNETMALPDYDNNQGFTANADDSILAPILEADYDPYIWTELMGDNLTDGVRGYMAIVVDTTYTSTISDPYWATTFLSAATASSTANGSSIATASVTGDDVYSTGVAVTNEAAVTSSATSSSASAMAASVTSTATTASSSVSTNNGVSQTATWGGLLSLLALPLMLV